MIPAHLQPMLEKYNLKMVKELEEKAICLLCGETSRLFVIEVGGEEKRVSWCPECQLLSTSR